MISLPRTPSLSPGFYDLLPQSSTFFPPLNSNPTATPQSVPKKYESEFSYRSCTPIRARPRCDASLLFSFLKWFCLRLPPKWPLSIPDREPHLPSHRSSCPSAKVPKTSLFTQDEPDLPSFSHPPRSLLFSRELIALLFRVVDILSFSPPRCCFFSYTTPPFLRSIKRLSNRAPFCIECAPFVPPIQFP